jgi:hypothetical protein
MTRLGNNLRGIRKMNEDDRKEGKPPQTPRQDRWQDDEFLTAGVRAAREDDRRRKLEAVSQEIAKAADAMNEMHARRFTRRLRNEPMTLTFDVEHPGDVMQSLRCGTVTRRQEGGYSDRVTVTVDSGDPGGDPGEFETFIQESLSQWFDGAAVGLRPANLPKNAYPVARKGRIEYGTVPED